MTAYPVTSNDLLMRGADTYTEGLFTLKKLEDFVPANHPLRVIRTMVNQALIEMGELFARMYEDDIKGGRPSIAPEKLLRAMLLQVLYSVRSERQLMEQTQYNLLFRWFIGLSMDDAPWVPTVFSKNRQRLIEHEAVVVFFNKVLKQADQKKWLSKEHFSVDGTLIQAWAGHKSFVPKDGGDDADGDGDDFRGRPRSNETHESSTDPDSRLYRKGNNYELADQNGTRNHSNVARLYDCFPGLSVPGVLSKDTDWTYKPERYQHFFRTYVPGVGSPFAQLGEIAKGAA